MSFAKLNVGWRKQIGGSARIPNGDTLYLPTYPGESKYRQSPAIEITGDLTRFSRFTITRSSDSGVDSRRLFPSTSASPNYSSTGSPSLEFLVDCGDGAGGKGAVEEKKRRGTVAPKGKKGDGVRKAGCESDRKTQQEEREIGMKSENAGARWCSYHRGFHKFFFHCASIMARCIVPRVYER